MTNELFFLGEPYSFKKGIKVYPPTVRDVVTNDRFSLYVKVLCSSQEDIEDAFMEDGQNLKEYPTPLEFLLNNCYHSAQYEAIAKEAFHFFIRQDVTFGRNQKLIIIGKANEVLNNVTSLDEIVTLTEDDFFDFQNLIREACGKKIVEKPDPNEHPKIKEMKRKARYRDRIKAKKSEGITLFTSLVSICCMGLGINPLNIGEMSYVALESIIRKYQDKEQYQTDIDALIAGGDSKKIKPKYWITNFEK